MSVEKFTSPIGGNRGCLCDDLETYHKDCCKGELINQGIGATVQQSVSNVQNNNEERTITREN